MHGMRWCGQYFCRCVNFFYFECVGISTSCLVERYAHVAALARAEGAELCAAMALAANILRACRRAVGKFPRLRFLGLGRTNFSDVGIAAIIQGLNESSKLLLPRCFCRKLRRRDEPRGRGNGDRGHVDAQYKR